jgi:hypothetical protein
MVFLPLPADAIPPLSDNLSWDLSLRSRAERRDDLDFDEEVSDNGLKIWSRGRIGLNYAMGEGSKARIVYQYNNLQNLSTLGSESQKTKQDLVEAYITRNDEGSTLTIGRQKVNKGAQRLMGALEWANTSRSFDGVRLSNGEWDFFAGQLALNPVSNYDVQVGLAANKNQYGETMLIYKSDSSKANQQFTHTGPTGMISHYTLNHRFDQKMGKVRVEAEGSIQWGRKYGADLEAWAGHAKLSTPVSGSMTAFLEGNIATGGSSDGTINTFDNLFPTNHLFYGYGDRQGLSNMTSLSGGVVWQARKDLSLEISAHTFSLYDEEDGWYGVGGGMNKIGGVNAIDATGNSGKDIGSELDFNAKWRLDNKTMFMGGVTVFQPGDFVKSFVNGTVSDSTWAYVQFSRKF